MEHDPKSASERINRTIESLSGDEKLTEMCQRQWCGEPLPSIAEVERIIDLCRALIFPGYFGESSMTPCAIPHRIGLDVNLLHRILTDQIAAAMCFDDSRPGQDTPASETAIRFIESLPELRRMLYTDVKATYLNDPAALSTREVIYCYPGIRATANYRVAHSLWSLGVPILPRMISESAHRETGIDIHPAARIGESFVIDHGTGVVIGATAVIGSHVSVYQGVTLGAKSFVTDDENHPVKGLPRHPIIGDNVVIYSNASILGRVNVGDGAIIGGNVWLTRDVAPGEKVLQATASTTSANK